MTEAQYKLTEEYRDRFAINKGERYWIDEAFKLYIELAKKKLTDDSVITPEYIELIFKDINSKLDCWTD